MAVSPGSLSLLSRPPAIVIKAPMRAEVASEGASPPPPQLENTFSVVPNCFQLAVAADHMAPVPTR